MINMPEPELPQYYLKLHVGEKVYPLRLTANELNCKKFLRKAPVLVSDERVFYQEIRQAIFKMDFEEKDICYQTNNNGLHKINGQLAYVFSNGSITKDGFSSAIYSDIGRIYIPEEAVIKLNLELEINNDLTQNLLKIFDCNAKVFYPLFFQNIAAICNGYFRMLGEKNFMKWTLWLDGNSGSGKTELAKAAGTFVFADKSLDANLISATGKARYILEALGNSSGSVFILDDVKQERVRERRNSVAAIVDDILRSTYQGVMTDASGRLIDTCSLVTGEYMDTHESQNARLLYLKVDQFLKEEKNSKALRSLQANPLLLTTVCCGFIQWFLNRIEETSFPQLLLEKLNSMRKHDKEYHGISNAERLNENMHMITMASEMAVMFFRDIGLTGESLSNFSINAGKSIRQLCDDTYVLLGGEGMILTKITENILKKCEIRKAQYKEDLKNSDCIFKYCQEEFFIHEGDDLVYIADMEKSLQLFSDDGHDQSVQYSYLIGREKHLMHLFASEIEDMQQHGQISSVIAETLMRNLPKKLKKAQIILKKYRADNAWGRTATNYPICSYGFYKPIRRDGIEQQASMGRVGIVSYEPVIQLNTTHSCMRILEKRLQDGEVRTTLPPLVNISYEGVGGSEEIHKTRKSFTVGKYLYRE